MPRRGGSGDGSGQDGWTCQPQPRLVACARLARPHGAAPEPPSRRALSWHQPSTLSTVAVAADLRTELLRLVPDERRVSDVESVLEQHAADLSHHAPRRPDVVVYPESTQ